MKKVFMITVLLLSITAVAQRPHHDNRQDGKKSMEKMNDFTPEQIAELNTKKLTLKLDLDVSQQQAINKIELERVKNNKARFENKKEASDLSSEEHFNRKKAFLDEQIAIKVEMKTILSESQYARWETGMAKKMKHRRRKGHGPRKS